MKKEPKYVNLTVMLDGAPTGESVRVRWKHIVEGSIAKISKKIHRKITPGSPLTEDDIDIGIFGCFVRLYTKVQREKP